jgi:hypothetical protein
MAENNGEPEHWRRLLVVFAVRSACDRAWAYFLPLALSSLRSCPPAARGWSARADGVLSAAAALYLVRTLVEVAAVPAAAACWDGTPRRAVSFLAAEHACLVVSAAVLHALGAAEGRCAPLPLLAACGVATGVEASLSKTLWNAVEKQQTFAESMRGDADGAHVRLAAKNAALSRIDLAVGALTPFGVGALASSLGVTRALVALVCIQLAAAAAAAPWLLRTVARQHESDDKVRFVCSAPMRLDYDCHALVTACPAAQCQRYRNDRGLQKEPG